jgi:hypothetical protein
MKSSEKNKKTRASDDSEKTKAKLIFLKDYEQMLVCLKYHMRILKGIFN